MRRCLPVLFWLLAVQVHIAGGSQPDSLLTARFEQKLHRLAARVDGVVGIAVKDLLHEQEFLLNGDEIFPQASVIKIPILVAFYEKVHRGELRPETMVRLDRSFTVGGSGVLQFLDDWKASLSLYDYAVLMIVLSDNTATNLLIDRVGMREVTGLMQRLGLVHTRLQRKMMDVEAARMGKENLSTPREMMQLLEILYRKERLSKDVASACLRILRLPKRSDLRAGIPATVPLACKTGGLARIVNEAGLVEYSANPYIVVVMTKLLKSEEEGHRLIREISRVCWEYFERIGSANKYGRFFR
jgi:beta-lactamase class A